jgi:hypothetical protein
MASDTTVAIGPNGRDDYRKLVLDQRGSLRSTLSGLAQAGRVTVLTLDDTGWTALPAAPLVNRNSIFVQNQSNNGGVVLFNYSASSPLSEGIRIEDGGFRSLIITDSIIVYAKMLAGLGVVAVEEIS